MISHERNITFSYLPESGSVISNCSLELSRNGEWSVYGVDTTIFNASSNTFYLPNLSVGLYGWNVLCENAGGERAKHVVDYNFIVG